ncbi:MAG: DUF615 domain-containing protein [Desulfobacterales bacterium]|nr:DUF615 domain-containing protein [Desulfobacterales bacterium]
MNDEPISRTQKKNEDRALQTAGEALAALSPEQIDAVDMPEELREALHFVRQTTSHGARRRQMQYIGSLMRRIDSEPLQRALDNIRFGDVQAAAQFKRIERWRDGLAAGDQSMLDEIMAAHPVADRQRLAQLARNARKHADSGEKTKSARALFRYLKELADGSGE